MTDFDVLVVGSGAGGGVAACVLAQHGLKVGLLEKGRNPYPTLSEPVLRGSLFANDEIQFRRRYAWHDERVEPRTFRINDQTEYRQGAIQSLGVAVGGGTIHYDGDSPRLQRADFRLLSEFGPIAGADVVDWPIGYEDLEPFYDETERIIGVQGQAGADPFAEPRRPYPMPPGYPTKVSRMLAEAARSLGLHPHPMPIAVNSIFYRGRPACSNCGFCACGCAINAKSSTAVTVIRDGLATGNLTVLPNCCVTRLTCEPSGERATGVEIIDPRGERQLLTAGQVIVAANAIESPRILLNSACAAHPDGLGNGSGLVGRYLMFHMVFMVMGVFEQELRPHRGRVIVGALADFTVHDGSPDYVRGGYVELGGHIKPVDYGCSVPWMMHNSLMKDSTYRRRAAGVTMIGEDVPQLANRVELDPAVRDVYGLPVARITYAYHDHDKAVIARYTPKLKEIAEAAGAVSTMEVDMLNHYGVPETKHLLGTLRMGTDPQNSVCDPWGRLHEVENVWIADGSLWPTSAAFNPVLTQQALAYRTAAFMLNPDDPRAVLP